ncbi:MAG TPA: TetR/AcrR family transcriptional regulator, partial [Tessaracoccus flavescens]|nr:TetR/AcrR family transcriptional regulator [Tessaracoccus flavescens]
ARTCRPPRWRTCCGATPPSIVKITEAAGVALGTFYLYFPGKLELFTEVVIDLNRQLRMAMSEGSKGATTRLEAERGGFRAYFDFIARNPAVYPIIREAWFVAPDALHLHYERIQAGYTEALADAVEEGEIAPVDPEVAAWALMGIGEMVGMRYQSWPDPDRTTAQIPDDVFEACMTIITNALTPRKDTHE